ncbi:DUF1254 domain-containing protein [Pseudomonas sp. 5P_3.1_Bac2]|uniref:DUF1254 domain-containing protein n=1 Tax=Pseudomonas sp. 5P_3.1_Bac2 TaxID=2971617 RepID=UPI0021CA485F|nr:DUF1254 domain-containing protein [Pseudomonas sp. 5P_3.1_Bac2]MCU1715684.1 DUF1254 domain-containing protein [Pseudomonas sp. 5P_3.1_Bac2]
MRLKIFALPFTLALGLTANLAAANDPVPQPGVQLDDVAFQALARDAYLYAYPLVTMDLTMRQATNTADASSQARRAPLNQFAHYRQYPDANAKDVVRFNFDTLYSLAWVDSKKEPVILTIPDSHGRYYLAPMLDMWTDVFAVPGTRTTANKPGNYAITSPGWQGQLPAGVEQIKAPTSMVWLITRIKTDGPADYANVHQFQDGLKLTPLSAWGTDYQAPSALPLDPAVDNQTPPQQQVNSMDGLQLLTRFSQLLKDYPPHYNDYPILYRLRALGLAPGQEFDPSRFSTQQLQVLRDTAKSSQQELLQAVQNAEIGKVANGWNWADNLGSYGTDYRRRALVALAGLGANLAEDAIYPNGFADADGKPYSGQNNYVLRFEADQLPPAEAFWSLTMYDPQGFQVRNPINRFAIGSYDKLKYGADGSLELYLQQHNPGADKASNWLPSPAEGFQLTLRLYSPKASVLKGQWQPPAVHKVQTPGS